MSAPRGRSSTTPSASPRALAERVRAVGEAWRTGNEQATRAELRALSDEARTLSRAVPLPLGDSRLAGRQRVASERGPSGRGSR